MTERNTDFITPLLKRPGLKVMGIINATPDSFSGDGVYKETSFIEKATAQTARFIEEGVDIIDIGGESTSPVSTPIDMAEELRRVIPIIQAIHAHFPHLPISVDTTKAEVARQAIKAGAHLINDVSGLLEDPEMSQVIAESQVPVVLMHSQWVQRKWPAIPGLDIVDTVKIELERLICHALEKGIHPQQIIIDPGIGAGMFGKSGLENLQLLKSLSQFKSLPYPLLVGASRKTFIGQLTGAAVEQRLPGSLAAVTLATLAKTDFIRVHDVAATKQVIQLLEADQ